MASPTEISAAQLSRLIGTPECPVLLDVRIPEDRAADPRLVPTARAQAHDALDDLDATGRVVVICHKGLKLSQGVAAILRARGIKAETLEGGHLGWAEAGLPLVATHNLPANGLWVTRHRPKIDRIACPWLIRRFIDPSAQFLYVSPSQVEAVADRFDASPFDIKDSFWGHRGEGCTFDTLLTKTGLSTPALDRLATIIRAADTGHPETVPEAPGLLAASLGLSRMYKGDLEQLEAGMALYDAFNRWARDAVGETHDH